MRCRTKERCWSTSLLTTLVSSIVLMATLENHVSGAFHTVSPVLLSHRSRLFRRQQPTNSVCHNHNYNNDCMEEGEENVVKKVILDDSMERRAFIGAAASMAGLFGYSPDSADAFSLRELGKRTDILLVESKKNATASAVRSPISSEFNSAEQCLLRLLPVKNPIFRRLESDIEGISLIRFAGT